MTGDQGREELVVPGTDPRIEVSNFMVSETLQLHLLIQGNKDKAHNMELLAP